MCAFGDTTIQQPSPRLQMWAPMSGFRMPLPLLGSAGRAPGTMPPAVMAAPPLLPQMQPHGQLQQLPAQPAVLPTRSSRCAVAAPAAGWHFHEQRSQAQG